MQLEIRPDPTEVGRARRWARSRLAGLGIAADEPLAETLILLVSELVTNAVVHTGRTAVLRLSLPGAEAEAEAAERAEALEKTERAEAVEEADPPVAATVRVEVADCSSRAPVPRCAGGDATGGRGLALVDCLADRWGWSPEGAGKSIWCELDRCSKPRESATMAYGSGLSAYEGLAFEAV
ncbi:ATP-binding protein [Streptomyces sp. CG1]|uniref:ATP-binding protein n=1 Tax=Streptomyces sp. CG1 TaxID=1287523 RepID=UPI0034E247A8